MARRRRLIKNDEDHDPMAVLTNLFDVAMVFAVALMVALVTRFDMTEMFSQEDFTVVKAVNFTMPCKANRCHTQSLLLITIKRKISRICV